MTLVVETPDTRSSERDYNLGVLLDDFLGLPWQWVRSKRRDVRIKLEAQPGEICLPDILLSVVDADWLTPGSMLQRPLPQWDTRDLVDEITLVDSVVPVIYGDRKPLTRKDGNAITLPVDIFGSAFFMLLRYEELVISERDEHDRFPAWASLAYKEGFLERLIVDEYVKCCG